jgi:spoIIIJ-associated protein
MRREPRTESPRPAASVESNVVLSGEPLAAAGFAERLPAVTVEKADEVIQNCAEAIMRRIGFFCRVQVADGDGEYRDVRIVTDAESADSMAGRRNSTISAVQHLVDRMSTRITGETVHVNVDINNYRQRRDGRLATLARDAMSRVKNSGEPEHLPAMNARERRLVHLEVAEIDGLTTITEGQDRDRHVVIKLEDASES